jgi:hypothetical protein
MVAPNATQRLRDCSSEESLEYPKRGTPSSLPSNGSSGASRGESVSSNIRLPFSRMLKRGTPS